MPSGASYCGRVVLPVCSQIGLFSEDAAEY